MIWSLKKLLSNYLIQVTQLKIYLKSFGVSPASIHRWNIELNMSKSQLEELSQVKSLEKELKEVRLERDILKKAVSIFSKSAG
jgi:transposase